MAHTRVAAPSSCLPRTLITAGGKHCPHSIHTHNTRKSANQNCAHATPNSQIRREQTRIVYTQYPIKKSQITQTHTHRSTQEAVGRSEDSREVGRVGIIKELWMRMGLKTGLNHIRRRHKVCSSSLANTRVLLC